MLQVLVDALLEFDVSTSGQSLDTSSARCTALMNADNT